MTGRADVQVEEARQTQTGDNDNGGYEECTQTHYFHIFHQLFRRLDSVSEEYEGQIVLSLYKHLQ